MRTEALLPDTDCSSDPEVGLPDPEVGLPDPEARLPDPEARVLDPEARLPDPGAGLPDPKAGSTNPVFGLPDLLCTVGELDLDLGPDLMGVVTLFDDWLTPDDGGGNWQEA